MAVSMGQESSGALSRGKHIVASLALVPIIVAVTAIFGWLLGIAEMRNPFAGQPPVAISTAFCLLVCSFAGVFQAWKKSASDKPAKAAGLVCAGVSGCVLLNYLFPWFLDLDQLIMQGTLNVSLGFSPGRMAPSTAACLVLLSLAIIVGTRTKLAERLWNLCLTLLLVMAATICVGYAYEASQLYGIGIFTPMALPTAISLFCLSCMQIAARPEIGLMKLLSGEQAGSQMARRMLPALIVIPVLCGYLRIIGQRAGLYDDALGTALLTLLMAVLFSVLTVRQALLLNRLSLQQERSSKAIELLYSELVQARDAALESAKLKSEFLANMSHEIRTPMNAVIGCADMLQRTRLSLEQSKFVDLIIASGNALMEVIDDILILSKIEAGKLEMQCVEINLTELTESVGQLLAEKARAKKLSLTTYASPEVNAIVLGDPQRLRQVLLNLLGNAVKFTEHGQVSLRADVQSEHEEGLVVRFTVSDTGIGINPDMVETVFEPFSQGDGSINRKFGGTGLGLAISRRLMHLMDGDISVQSIPGQGSIFTVVVPLQRAENSDRLRSKQAPMGVRLLVVGSPINEFEVCKDYCQSWGVQADYAPTAQSAMYFLDVAAETHNNYQLILCDGALQDISVFAFKQKVLDKGYPRKSAFVMLTQLDQIGQLEEAVLKGFKSVLTKPLRQSELFDCIMEVINTRQKAAPAPAMPAQRLDNFGAALPDDFSKEILVVEDNEINREVISMQLRAIGFEPVLASNGVEALDILAIKRFGLILMDCQMPQLNGFDATREIRRIEQQAGYRTSIVAMTANAMEGDRQACLDAGMDDYLSKPVTASSLKEMIERWFLVLLESPKEPEAGLEDPADAHGPVLLTQMASRSWDLLALNFDPDTATNFLNLFVEQTPPLMNKIGAALREKELRVVAEAAHELKGACLAVHIVPLGDTSRAIELAAGEGDVGTAAKSFEDLQVQFLLFKEQWTNRLSEKPAEDATVPNKNIRVFLVEDNELTRLAIKALFAKIEGIDVCGEAVDGEQALRSVIASNPDVVLLDIGLPTINGIEVTRRLKMISPYIKALMLTSHDSDEDMFAAFAAGADGYVVKHSFDRDRLLLAVRTVASGCCWLDPLIAQRVLSVASASSKQIAFPGISEQSSIAPLSSVEESMLRRVALTESECAEGVCQVDPAFLANLHRFGKRQPSSQAI